MATISEALAMAVEHHQAGRLEMAEQVYRQILALQPDQPDALHLLGVIAHQVGKNEVAVDYIRRAIVLQPQAATLFSNLGLAYRALGKMEEAAACFQRAIELKPGDANAYNELGMTLQKLWRLDEALACYHRAIQVAPEFAEAHNNTGIALQAQGKPDEAAACYRRALQIKPNAAKTLVNLGVVLQELGSLDEAAACHHRAIEIEPDFAEAYNNLGNAFQKHGKFDEAVACYRRAIEIKPAYADAYSNLGSTLKHQGDLDETAACYRRAMEIEPGNAVFHSNYLCCRQYRPNVTLSDLAREHDEWEQRHAMPLRAAWQAHGNRRDPERRLRLGFVSPDFGEHPVGRLLVAAFESLGRHAADKFCYSDRAVQDGITARFQAAADTWRDVRALSDEGLAEQIRADGIDILFDLTGHTSGNRLLALARKPAPVQITWIGYEGTTGLAAMDYLLADRWMAAEGVEGGYREQVLRLPDGYVCYDRPAAAPPVGPLPARRQGYLTLASFNNMAKITPLVVSVWAEILQRLPQARLLLKYRGLERPAGQRRWRALFAAHGVEADRLEFSGWSPLGEALAEYNRVDIALDPFPFSGSLTTCDALWMGVPVITWPGQTFAGRHTLSHLGNVGLADAFVARDLADYVQRTVHWANDLDRLAEVRAALRDRMAASPLCDGERFAANLMHVLRDAWRRWASTTSPPTSSGPASSGRASPG